MCRCLSSRVALQTIAVPPSPSVGVWRHASVCNAWKMHDFVRRALLKCAKCTLTVWHVHFLAPRYTMPCNREAVKMENQFWLRASWSVRTENYPGSPGKGNLASHVHKNISPFPYNNLSVASIIKRLQNPLSSIFIIIIKYLSFRGALKCCQGFTSTSKCGSVANASFLRTNHLCSIITLQRSGRGETFQLIAISFDYSTAVADTETKHSERCSNRHGFHHKHFVTPFTC